MSFEQKKRLSIGVELAANPAILFLDEPTTGLDSRAAQVVTRSIRRVAASGRSIVCTIHQPSFPIFSTFDSLLLLKRGGQTVFFGPLGENCDNLIHYFEGAQGVTPIKAQQNPASWMLECIGAGTAAVESLTDFHVYYKTSTLCSLNTEHLNAICTPPEDEDVSGHKAEATEFGTSTYHQLKWVGSKVFLSYWRTPSYNLSRMIIALIIALIFASAYANQSYSNIYETISRSAVIYITCLFVGVIGMMTVVPVGFAERGAFYREQQSEMYSVWIYALVTFVVEIPVCITLSILVFTVA